jgi:alpha-galactosidase/6-phospho-beta-glucosidase family protein
VECQGVVNSAGIRGVSVPLLPPKLMAGAMIPRWQRAEMLVNAMRTRDRDLLLLYLLDNHQTRSLAQAEELLDAWLAHPLAAGVAAHFGGPARARR